MAQRKVLVVGASGLVGFETVRHFEALPDWDVVGVSRRRPEGLGSATHISVDLTDTARCAEVFGAMTDVTHVVYTAVHEIAGNLIAGWRTREQMQTNLQMIRNLFEPLERAARNLEHVTLFQGTKAYGVHVGAIPVPARERWPRHPHENFYWLQQDYITEKQLGRGWSWTILRPQLIFGEAIKGNLNVLPPIAVYAVLERAAGRQLSYPGGAPLLFEAVDTELLARAIEWAATTPVCRNEIYNICNGDVFTFQNLWPTIADCFDMVVGPPRPVSLAESLPRREAEWADLVRKHDLVAPPSIHDFLGESAELADYILAYGAEESPPPVLVSTIKARQHGFHDCIDTEDMLRKWIARYREARLLPP